MILRTGLSKVAIFCALIGLAIPSSAGAFAPASLDPWLNKEEQSQPSMLQPIQYEYGGYSGETEDNNDLAETPLRIDGDRRAAQRSLRRVEGASRSLRGNLNACNQLGRGGSSAHKGCVTKALEQYSRAINSRRVQLQRKPEVVRSVREAVQVVQQTPAPRVQAAARVVRQKAEEVRDTIPLITLADDALVDIETRAVETIASDLELVAAALIEVQGVWLIVPGMMTSIDIG